MRKLAIMAVVVAAGCTTEGGWNIPTPGSIGNTQARLAQFCATDFTEQPVTALGEWVAFYNLLAPIIEREPIDVVGGLSKNEAVQRLLAVRAVMCLTTQPMPAPAVVEAVAAAE